VNVEDDDAGQVVKIDGGSHTVQVSSSGWQCHWHGHARDSQAGLVAQSPVEDTVNLKP